MTSTKRQEGSAIITALLLVVFITAIVSLLLTVQHVTLKRTQHIINSNQMQAYALSGEDQAIEYVKSLAPKEEGAQRRTVDWPVNLDTTSVQGGEVQVIIHDLQSRFNINNLIDQANIKPFVAMLRSIEPDLKEKEATDKANAIHAWFSPTTELEVDTHAYENAQPPYQPAQQAMQSISELRLVAGMEPNLVSELLPYLTAISNKTATPININTALRPVILSLSENMTVEDAREIIVRRQEQGPFRSAEEFNEFLEARFIEIEGSKVVFQSEYYLVEVKVSLNKQSMTSYTLFQLTVPKLAGQVTHLKIFWRSRGSF